MKGPHAYLNRLISRHQRTLDRLGLMEKRFLRIRMLLALLVLGSLAVALLFESGPAWLATAGLLAVILVVAAFHHRHRVTARRWKRSLDRQRRYQARLLLRWPEIPEAMQAAEPSPLEQDLDLIGTESLLQLLDATLTDGGCRQLRQWLAAPELEANSIQLRQGLVRELSDLQILRNRIHRRAGGRQLSTASVARWIAAPDAASELAGSLRWSALLIASSVLLAVMDFFWGLGRVWLLPLAGNFLYVLSRQTQLRSVFQRALSLESQSESLRSVFETWERFQPLHRPQLEALLERLQSQGGGPSHLFAQISRLVSLLSVRAHPLFWTPLNIFLPWDFLFGWSLERLRMRSAQLAEQWLRQLHLLDALNCLALFAFLHPECAFPEVTEEVRFKSRKLGHPLISPVDRVSNDFELEGTGSIALITGSNMAGKSTFLRTLGVNLQLAYAGAPVCATAMTTGIFRVFTCIRISDSVTDGYSYFYAEVRRLRRLLEALEDDSSPTLVFLIDEIFKGTNNRERLIGSRSYIRTLASSTGLGLITTHDLELTQLARELSGLQNFHFREEVVDGAMQFDYRLRPGPCPTTNALQIMRLAGLPVDDPEG